jgi:hypothetical protein
MPERLQTCKWALCFKAHLLQLKTFKVPIAGVEVPHDCVSVEARVYFIIEPLPWVRRVHLNEGREQ